MDQVQDIFQHNVLMTLSDLEGYTCRTDIF